MSRLLFLVLITLSISCQVYSDCSQGEVCENQVCYKSPRHIHDPCSTEYPCKVGLSCELGRCYNNPRSLYDPCSKEACKQGYVCDQTYKICLSSD